MTMASRLEQFVRLSAVGSHKNSGRAILDIPAGYLHGRNVAVSNVITLSGKTNVSPLGQHYHSNYGEIFAVVHGGGDLYLEVVGPGQRNRLNENIVVPRDFVVRSDLTDLVGAKTKIKVESKDDSKKIVRVVPGVSHTFVLRPNSILIAYLFDTPKNFDSKDPSNYHNFPLI